MSHSQFHSTKLFILRHAWLNLWDKRMTTGRINQVYILSFFDTRASRETQVLQRKRCKPRSASFLFKKYFMSIQIRTKVSRLFDCYSNANEFSLQICSPEQTMLNWYIMQKLMPVHSAAHYCIDWYYSQHKTNVSAQTHQSNTNYQKNCTTMHSIKVQYQSLPFCTVNKFAA